MSNNTNDNLQSPNLAFFLLFPTEIENMTLAGLAKQKPNLDWLE